MNIQKWLEEHLELLLFADNQKDFFEHLATTASVLGFDYCAFGLRAPYPVMNPKTIWLSNYSSDWQIRYVKNNYFAVDPVVQHGSRSTFPLIWSSSLLGSAPDFWEDAKEFGIDHGWSQSYCNADGFLGMLTLARSGEALQANELADKQMLFSWLTQLAHQGLYKLAAQDFAIASENPLTQREVEVLRWSAEGKSAHEIATQMGITERTVNFHINNVLQKTGTHNKTAAVVKAVLLRWI
ncbi:LuxR family transcriptional regulator [Methyloglobulus sp.]|uniref:LuxR family transcriptional regulator n=1 Tax=Methyloglobulus sp. TaxID=2518622 RepID=UPI0032B75FE6